MERRTIQFKGREVRLLLSDERVKFEVEDNGKPLTFMTMDDVARHLDKAVKPTPAQVKEQLHVTSEMLYHYQRGLNPGAEYDRALFLFRRLRELCVEAKLL